jgi:hypothetical protein
MVSHQEASGSGFTAEGALNGRRQILAENEIEALSRRGLNGRQIKNVVRTAQALARSTNEPLGMKHLKDVLEVTEGFEKDLKGTGQLDSGFLPDLSTDGFDADKECLSRHDELCIVRLRLIYLVNLKNK